MQEYKVIVDDVKTEWFNLDLQRHREDGPAIIRPDGTLEYWINYKRLSKQEFDNQNNPVELTLDEIAEKLNIPVENLKIKK